MRRVVIVLLMVILAAVPVEAKTTVTLNGTTSITAKRSVKLPGMENPPGKTFLGWDTKKGKKKNPKYEVGERVKGLNLHAVYFDRKNEPNVRLRDPSKHLIMVGDSRTVQLDKVYNGPNASFIARGGKGLKWMQEEGEAMLMRAVSDHKSEDKAVIIALGVNDLWNADKYVDYLNNLADRLNGCDLFFLSVNPMNNAVRKHSRKSEAKIRGFNDKMRNELQKYHYIDSYTYLVRNGYTTYVKNRMPEEYYIEGGKDDGLHYGYRTCKRIFNLCVKAIG